LLPPFSQQKHSLLTSKNPNPQLPQAAPAWAACINPRFSLEKEKLGKRNHSWFSNFIVFKFLYSKNRIDFSVRFFVHFS
jgi:hypothetical protein